jgi:hypothetical protein
MDAKQQPKKVAAQTAKAFIKTDFGKPMLLI